MSKKRYALLVMLTVISGLVGGAVSSLILTDQLVFAQRARKQRVPQHVKVITAEEIRIVDKSDVVRVRLGVHENGVAFINVSDGRMTWHGAQLSSDPNGEALLELTGENGSVFANTHKGPAIWVDQRPVDIKLGIDTSGVPSLVFSDSRAIPIELSLSPNGEPYLDLSDKNGTSRARLGYAEFKNPRTGSVETRPVSSLILFGEGGQLIWQAP